MKVPMALAHLAVVCSLLADTVAGSVDKPHARTKVLKRRQRNTLPHEVDDSPHTSCTRETYSIPSIAARTAFDLNALGYSGGPNQTQISELFVQLVTQPDLFTSRYVQRTNVQVTESFQISGVLCKPKNTSTAVSDTLQVLVHGIGFDSFYWNLQGPGVPASKYSYIDAAGKAGLTTFRFDRLGTGLSQKPADGINTVQAPTELGILISILDSVKNSNLIGGKKWAKTLLIGHSYGSVQTNAASKARPDLMDGVVITGFTTSGALGYYLLSADYEQAASIFPDRFSTIGSNYLVTATPYSAQINFNVPAYVEAKAAALIRSVEQPVTQGAYFTLGGLPGPTTFTGPALALTSDLDFIFTFRSADAESKVAQTVAALYPNSSNATSYVPKGPGHGLNYHVQAPEIYKYMIQWAADNGFA